MLHNVHVEQDKMSEDSTAEMEWSPSNDTRPPDITLVLESSWKFHAHKDMLMKCSDYFAAMFSSQMIESTQDVVKLHIVQPDLFQILVEGMYTGELALTEDNVFNVVQEAEMLQINDPLKSIYLAFMRDKLINLEYCFELMHFCISLNLKRLYCDARRFCLANLSRLKKSTALANLTFSELYDYLSDKFLIVEAELHTVHALHHWLCENKNFTAYSSATFKLNDKVQKFISECISYKDDEDACDIITKGVLRARLPFQKIQFRLSRRKRQEDIYMFWSLLTTSSYVDGLVDILRLNVDTGEAHSVGKMTDIVERPGFQLGSATCYFAQYVYISGGGPEFGKANWIRQIWRFDASKPWAGWEAVADLIEFRRSHAMLILKNKLYVFGGFGKFRIKNSQMHRLDLVTGKWKELAPMPVHEFSPSAVTTDNCLYYISSNWTVHCFSTKAGNWSNLNILPSTFNTFPPETKPVAFFSVKIGDTNCFAVLNFTRSCLQITLLCQHKHTSSLHRHKDTATRPNFFTYAGSVQVNEKLVVFFTSQKSDDPIGRDDEVKHFMSMISFDPSTNQFGLLTSVQNVIGALSIVAMPYFPSEFKMACKELL